MKQKLNKPQFGRYPDPAQIVQKTMSNEKIKVRPGNRIEKVGLRESSKSGNGNMDGKLEAQNKAASEPDKKGPVQSGNLPAPDQETVTNWVRKDIDSAIYFLSMLREHPELIEKMAVEIFNFSKTHNPNLDGTGGTNSNE